MHMTYAYFDKGVQVKAVISGTYQLESIKNQHICNAPSYMPEKRYEHGELFRKGLRGCYHQSGWLRRKNLQWGRAHKSWSPVQPHGGCFPLWALTVRHLCGTSSSQLIRMSGGFFTLSSVQKNNTLGGKALAVLRVKTEQTFLQQLQWTKWLIRRLRAMERGKTLVAFRGGLKYWVPLFRVL